MNVKTTTNPRFLLIVTAILPAALLFVACSQNADGDTALRFASTIAGASGELGEAFGVAVRDGDIYVSDGQNGRIWRSHAGAISVFADGLSTPSGIVFAPDGRLLIADSGSSSIKSVDGSGVVTAVAGVGGRRGFADGDASTALFNAPVGIAVATDGRIFVADTYNDRIRVIENGQVTTLAGGTRGYGDSAGASARFDTPTGLAVWQDKLLVADTGNRRIRVVEPNGVVWTLAGADDVDLKDGMASQAAFVEPTGLAIDASGTIYVGDGNAVRAISGIFPIAHTVSASSRGASDGALRRARFNGVTGIAVEPDGSVIVGDSENRLVRRLSHDAGPQITEDQAIALRGTPEDFKNAAPARWPFDPPGEKREIAGTLGEIRGDMTADPAHARFHNGLDIAGSYGETARFVREEKVLRPLSAENFGTLRELVRLPTMGYIHVRLGRDKEDKPFGDDRFAFSTDASGRMVDVRVPRGAVFRAGDAVGTLNAMNHVHLVAGRSGSEMNALDALILPGITDSKPPVVEGASFWSNGTELKPQNGKIRIRGNIRIVMRAFDQVDGNVARRRLGLYKAGWQLLRPDKTPVNDIQWNIRFDRMPPPASVPFVYAAGSKSGATGETIFNYLVTNRVEGDHHLEGWLDAFDPGEYVVRVWAGDYFGNNSYLDTAVVIEK